MKKRLIFFLALFCTNIIYSQNSNLILNSSFEDGQDTLKNNYSNNIQFNLFSNYQVINLFYEYCIFKKNSIAFNLGTGLCYTPITGSFDNFGIPFYFNNLLGESRSKIEFKASTLFLFDFSPFPNSREERKQYLENPILQTHRYQPPVQLSFTPEIGYRYYTKNMKYFFKISLYYQISKPHIEGRIRKDDDWLFLPFGSFGLGYSF